MQRTNLYLESRQCELLDKLARTEGVSRAEIVRRIIDQALSGIGDDDLQSDLEAIDASFGVLADEMELVPLARKPGARAAHLARVGSER
jgi:hypothetical protein